MASEPRSGPRKLSSMSIPKLISELRDSFLSGDFDRVEEALVAREGRLKAELEEKKREIVSLKERVSFERSKRINAELELTSLRQNGCGAGEKLKSDDGIVVKSVKCKVEGVSEGEGEKVGALGEKERGGSVLENGKGRKVCEEGKEVVGIDGSVPQKMNEGGIEASGEKLGTKGVVIIDDSDEDECNSQAMLDKKETTSCTFIDNDHRSSSSGALQKNLLTGLAESIENLKRKLVSSRNVLDDLDSDASSSSSSSGPLNIIDSLSTSKKKLRDDATSLGLNFSQR